VEFIDLVGSTRLAEKLDPEELREVILAYQEACTQEIRCFNGYIARYIGDGLLVYFGYPQAHEDDAQRAVRAGLGIVAALPALNARLQQALGVLREWPLQVRIGIHTGLVVVGDMGGGGYRDPMAIIGETPNIAARLQGIAAPDTVVISAATRRLIAGLFSCRDLGPQELKGVSTPMPVYRVLGESGIQSRLEVAVQTGLTPLVGREQEVGLLLERWAQVKEGQGQVVLVSGEAGIGKSRLVRVLKERIADEPHTWLECRCSPYYQNSAFYPVIDLLQRVLQFQRDDTPEEKLQKLEESLGRYGFDLQDTMPLLASLLSLPLPERYPPSHFDPPEAEGEDAASPAQVASSRGRAAAGVLHTGRPPVGRPFDARVSQSAGRSRTNDSDSDAAGVSAGVQPAVDAAVAPEPDYTRSAVVPAGARDGRESSW
jgi:class 3 adenylate cyclase